MVKYIEIPYSDAAMQRIYGHRLWLECMWAIVDAYGNWLLAQYGYMSSPREVYEEGIAYAVRIFGEGVNT